MPECKICFEKYEVTGNRSPRVFNCGHTYCESCIQVCKHQFQIKCPFCTTTSYQINFSTNKLILEVLNGKSKDTLSCTSCQLTYSSQTFPRIHPSCGHSVCEDCKEPFCKICKTEEDRVVEMILVRNGWNSTECPSTTQSEICWRNKM